MLYNLQGSPLLPDFLKIPLSRFQIPLEPGLFRLLTLPFLEVNKSGTGTFDSSGAFGMLNLSSLVFVRLGSLTANLQFENI